MLRSLCKYKRSKNFDKRPNRRPKKFTDEENRTARKSHCERTAVDLRQQCIADTVVRQGDGPRRLSNHDECVARVGSAVYLAPRSDTLECTPVTAGVSGRMYTATNPLRSCSTYPSQIFGDDDLCRAVRGHLVPAVLNVWTLI